MSVRVLILAAMFCGICAQAAPIIAPNTYFIEGETGPDRQPDGNSIVIVAPQGLIVFDTGRHRDHTQQVLDVVRAQGRPLAAIINSHWHLDHVGGNPRLRVEFPALHVYASAAIDAARGGFLAEYRAQLAAGLDTEKDLRAQEAARAEIALIDAGAALGPTDIIAKSVSLRIAGRALQLHLEPHAVTAGDVWVFDPETRVLLAGDLVTLPAPFFDTACPAHWRDALSHLAAVRFDRLVPGHGATMRRRDFILYRNAFSDLLDCAASDAHSAACIDGWVRDASTLIRTRDLHYAKALVGYYMENNLRHPSERVRNFCSG
jgi:glyoxylase-like metal-dependent hydrolase (beta-lactamase superfamily II)